MIHKILVDAVMKWEIDGGYELPVGISEFLTKKLMDKYLELRNLWAEIFNAHIEDWNQDFEKIHPELDGYSKQYNDFILRMSIERQLEHEKFLKGPFYEFRTILKYDKKDKFYTPVDVLTIKLGFLRINGYLYIET